MMETLKVNAGKVTIGAEAPIVVQTMCNTHTSDVEASVAQCRRLAMAGAELIRLTVPSLAQVESLREIHSQLRAEGIDTPLVADVHFSAEIAICPSSWRRARWSCADVSVVSRNCLSSLWQSSRHWSLCCGSQAR